MPTTRTPADELRELEELWAAPAVPEPGARATERRLLPTVPGGALAVGWTIFFVGVLLFEPASSDSVHTPLWGDLLVGGFVLTLMAAALLGSPFARFGFAAATVGGVLGMAVAVACRATGHHLGAWWLLELGAAAALTALAATGLRQRLRRE
ncbi:MAG TPA: hypothetical protein VHF23_01610 [Gaiellaceae bacterium]|nr:hypothetical protein [Gaiellaceae bacterium]